jgi:hypothetical protein
LAFGFVTYSRGGTPAGGYEVDSGRKSEAQRHLRDVQDKAFFKERKRIEAINTEKTTRLKTLRLAKEAKEAKEAEDAKAAALVAQDKPAKSKRGVARSAGKNLGESGDVQSSVAELSAPKA